PTTSCRGCPQPAPVLRAWEKLRDSVADQLRMGERTMSLHSWMRNLRSASVPRCRHQRLPRQGAKPRLNVEVLEDRCVPALYSISSLGFAAVDLNEAGRSSAATATMRSSRLTATSSTSVPWEGPTATPMQSTIWVKWSALPTCPGLQADTP